MRFLTPDECVTWAADHGFPLDPLLKGDSLAALGFRSTEFRIPSDAGRRVALARLLWEAGGVPRPQSLLWVTQWSVWPSGEHVPLALYLRAALGGKQSLSEAPGHLIDSSEGEAGISLLAVALLFLWDAYLLSTNGELAVFISHDEWGTAFTRNPDAWFPLEQRLARFRGPAA